MLLLQVTAAMAVDRELVIIVLARKPSNGDPKLPRSTRLSPKPLKSMRLDHQEDSQSQPRGACPKRPPKCIQDGAAAVSGYPFTHQKLQSTAHGTKIKPLGNQGTQPHIAAHRRVSDPSSAAQNPLSTRARGKDDGS